MNHQSTFADKLSGKLMDVGNIAIAALVIGQLVSERPFHWALAVAGFVLWMLLYAGAFTALQWGSKEGE